MSIYYSAAVRKTVRCAVCAGSGSELVLCPDGSIGVKSCWWCDGTGEIDQGEDPGTCPKCRRAMVPVLPDEGVCPDCTVFVPCDGLFEDEREYDFTD